MKQEDPSVYCSIFIKISILNSIILINYFKFYLQLNSHAKDHIN